MVRPLFAALVLGSAVYAAADLPLTVGRVLTGQGSQVELTNTGSQPVNAWSLTITTAAGEGRTHQVARTMDAYLSEATRGVAGFPNMLDRVNAGETRAIPFDPLPADATVRVVAVVLEDGTAAGDPAVIRSIFEHRVKERDELGSVVETFHGVLGAQHGLEALQELKRRFASSPSPESTPHRAAREAVDSYLQRATAENADQIEQLLRGYVALVERQHQLAVRHSQQR